MVGDDAHALHVSANVAGPSQSTWQGPVHQTTGQVVGNDTHAPHIGANAAGPSQSTWPSETDLFFPQGSNRLSLSFQSPLIRLVVQDAINHVQASLLLDNAFPEGMKKIKLVHGCLLAAAVKHRPSLSAVHGRLLGDSDYATLMIRMVCSMFSEDLSLNLSCGSHVFGFHCSGVKPRSGAI